MFVLTLEFLDYFDLKSLDELPTLGGIQDFDSLNVELDLQDPNGPASVRSMPAAVSQNTPSEELSAESTAVQTAEIESQPLRVVSTESTAAEPPAENLPGSIASDPDSVEESGDKSIA